jgi:hypothetical protein
MVSILLKARFYTLSKKCHLPINSVESFSPFSETTPVSEVLSDADAFWFRVSNAPTEVVVEASFALEVGISWIQISMYMVFTRILTRKCR